ncbi:hypothetical protein [Pseudomonas sp.]|uniref:hypothetical protein n=1 Tax=Pseudomonas sp. TaxID=306 RepID=UPI003D6E7781
MNIIKTIALPLLLASTTTYAASYCDSKPTQQAINNCYKQSASTYKKAVDKSLSELLEMPGQNAQSKAVIMQNQKKWESQVQNSCSDFACFEYQFIGRLTQINRLKEQQSKIKTRTKAIDPNQCLNAWIDAYRKEAGEDATVTQDQGMEWEGWCSEGKLP